ncbi:Protein-lysine N-methyltransferase efm4 [Microbotryomycetes sp. JL221]|nr:Protein-lysine N-methyltransferase efm4 [Microbotryomycetes sp. JL221]
MGSLTATAVAVIVTVPQQEDATRAAAADKSHHNPSGTGFRNPWPSFEERPNSIASFWNLYQEWNSKPVPSAQDLPQVLTPDWGLTSTTDKDKWVKQIKVTWLGHACFLVEFPVPAGAPVGTRGARVLFDPVWSHRCSPVQFMGPARVTKPPIELEDMPPVDATVLSHSHYDHFDHATLNHIAKVQPQGSVHFFAPLGNKPWFRTNTTVADKDMTEMDWWEARELSVELAPGFISKLKITCTPCQHFSGRGLLDRNKTLWASWAVELVDTNDAVSQDASKSGRANVWFAGDTGLRTAGKGMTPQQEDTLPRCPAFKQIGDKLGPFAASMIPIGAYSPRYFMSRVHCNPEDAVEVHLATQSKKSVSMHHSTWMLTDEEMTEPRKRLVEAAKKQGLKPDEFVSINIGETMLIDP